MKANSRTKFVGSQRFCKLEQLMVGLALIAMLFAPITPVVSHLLRSSPGSIWIEVCSGIGFKKIALDISAQSVQKQSKLPLAEHCPFCFAQAHVPLVPKLFSSAHVPFVVTSSLIRWATQLVPCTRMVWRAHLARAPPLR